MLHVLSESAVLSSYPFVCCLGCFSFRTLAVSFLSEDFVLMIAVYQKMAQLPLCFVSLGLTPCPSLSQSLYPHLSNGISVCPSVCLSLSLSVSVSLCLSVPVSLCLSVSVSLCLSVSISLSVCLSLSLSVSVPLSVCLSVCLCLSVSQCLYRSVCRSLFLFPGARRKTGQRTGIDNEARSHTRPDQT